MEKKFTIITGHGKIDFIQKADGKLELLSVSGRPMPIKAKTGKLGKAEVKQ